MLGTCWRRETKLLNQPGNNPELNVLDHGLLISIKPLHTRTNTSNIDDLIEPINDIFDLSESNNLGNVSITNQSWMKQVNEPKHRNDYKSPHFNKSSGISSSLQCLLVQPGSMEALEMISSVLNHPQRISILPHISPILAAFPEMKQIFMNVSIRLDSIYWIYAYFIIVSLPQFLNTCRSRTGLPQ